MKRLRLFLILLLLTNATVSLACKCPSISVKDSYKTSDVIITVTILKVLPTIDNKGDTTRIPFFGYQKRALITKTFKGQTLSDTITIEGEDSNCELYLEVGKSYLIYGYVVDNKIHTDRCTRSGLLYKHPDIKYLERKRRQKNVA